jgi:pilus assembly protein Flp/PilA
MYQMVLNELQRALMAFQHHTRKFNEGQGLVEYALILVLVAVVVIFIMSVMGSTMGNIFSNIVCGVMDAQNAQCW